MTLPKGFGGSGRCTQCGEYKYNSQPCDNPKCNVNRTDKNNDIVIPLPSYTIFKYIYYVVFFTGVTLLLTSGMYGDEIGSFAKGAGSFVIGFFIVILSILLVLMKYDTFQNEEEEWRKRKELLFWAVPFANFIHRIKFTSENK